MTTTPHELERCSTCGRYGWHSTDQCPGATSHVAPPFRAEPPIEDTFRRIRNILDVCPATSWDPAEARLVLTALETIVFERQAKTAAAEIDGWVAR
jgi:hypothetical protein